MSLGTQRAIFSPRIAGKPFYSGRGGNWWVLKVKFPRRAGTYCENHSYWNVSNGLSLRRGWIWEQYCVHSQEEMCSEVERGSRGGFSEQNTFDCGWRCYCYSLQNCQMVSCSNCAGTNRMKAWKLRFGLYLYKRVADFQQTFSKLSARIILQQQGFNFIGLLTWKIFILTRHTDNIFC